MISPEKLELLGELSKNCAHELNNVFAAITGFASVVEHELDADSPMRRDVRGIQDAAMRGVEITRNMMGFGASHSGTHQPVRINEMVQLVRSLLMRAISPEVQIELRLDERVGATEANSIQLKQALVNLGLNAAEAMRGPGRITISTEALVADADGARSGPRLIGHHVRIRVSDTGGGMEADVLDRCFEPFFTTKSAHLGLGLALVGTTIEQHGGSVEIFSKRGLGTTVTLYLPQTSASAPPRTSPLPPPREGDRRGLILLVDDDVLTLAAAKRLLETLRFEVIAANSGAAALDAYTAHSKEIDLVLLDLIMPERDGLEVLADLRRVDPNVRVIIASGYPLEQLAADRKTLEVLDVLEKPYTRNQLERTLAEHVEPAQRPRRA